MPELTVESLLHHRAEELREIKDRIIDVSRIIWARPCSAEILMRRLVDDLMLKIREAEEQYAAF